MQLRRKKGGQTTISIVRFHSPHYLFSFHLSHKHSSLLLPCWNIHNHNINHDKLTQNELPSIHMAWHGMAWLLIFLIRYYRLAIYI